MLDSLVTTFPIYVLLGSCVPALMVILGYLAKLVEDRYKRLQLISTYNPGYKQVIIDLTMVILVGFVLGGLTTWGTYLFMEFLIQLLPPITQ